MMEAIERFRTRKAQVEVEMSRDELIRDPERMRSLRKEHSELSGLISAAEKTEKLRVQLAEAQGIIDENEDEELSELARQEVENLAPRLEAAERELNELLAPGDPKDGRDVILEIRAGTGGEEAALFAADLFRMYTRYAERNGWKSEILSGAATGLKGFKEIICSVSGKKVFKRFKFESGTHRVQRIPVTESGGRIHTSAVTVAVMPEADKVDNIDIKTEDLRIDTYRSSSAGGQHVNKTDSAVRITHIPTGLVVSCQDQRSQYQNKEKALMLLRTHLLDMKEQQQKDAIDQNRKLQVGSGDRSQRIRTYNFPQGRITDHRIGLTIYRLEDVLEGDLDEIIDALLSHDAQERAKQRAG